ncbi:MAG TPA: hypothetical protein VGB62_02610 [Allosphingosinicella sp.]|jgi:hypothetical protein
MTPDSKRTRAQLIREEALTRSPEMAQTLREIADELEALADAQETQGRVAGPDAGDSPFRPDPSAGGASAPA